MLENGLFHTIVMRKGEHWFQTDVSYFDGCFGGEIITIHADKSDESFY